MLWILLFETESHYISWLAWNSQISPCLYLLCAALKFAVTQFLLKVGASEHQSLQRKLLNLLVSFIILNVILCIVKHYEGQRWFKNTVVLPEDLGFIPSTDRVAHNHM